ncbi:MAG: hypothetical protein M1816_001571 [Peltula sp. TS41687]|nr:MAG: hypothetical protein M1816_001571 [Peltula sp. TS41687]
MAETSFSNRVSRFLRADEPEEGVSAPERRTSDGQSPEGPFDVSDGFGPRPNRTEDEVTTHSLQGQSLSIPSERSTDPAVVSPASLSTIPGRSKTEEATDSFALQHDGQSQQVRGGSSRSEKMWDGTALGGNTNPTYTLQTGSSGSYLGDGFNSLAPEGYGFGSEPSVAGMATNQNLEGSHRDVAAPQHPYTLYPQNTLSDDNQISPVSPIAFGLSVPHQPFRGQQNLGGVQPQPVPGLDEQLPPYTRYPSTLPRNNTEEQGSSPMGDSGSPLDVATLGESEVPQQSINNSQSQITTHSTFSDTSHQRLRDFEKPTELRRTKRLWLATRKKRVCCGRLPLWGLLSVIVILILVVALVMGIIMGKRQHREIQELQAARQSIGPPTSTIYTTTTTYDASLLLAAPTDLPSLPFGTFVLNLGDAETAETNCLADGQNPAAWSCDLSVDARPQVLISVTPAQATSPDLVKVSALGMRPGPAKYYGTQPPSMNQPTNLSVAVDKTDLHAGTAYVFQSSYDKLVILDDGIFNPPANTKRALEDYYTPRRHGMALQPNDRPWYCYWNNTILEGFIYVTKNASGSDSSQNGTTTSTNPLSSTPTTSATYPDPTTSSDPSFSFPSYPKVVKLEERRDPMIQKEVKPYCQQMQVLDDMNLGPATQPGTSDNIIIYLNETEPLSTKLKRSLLDWDSYSDHHSKKSRRNYDWKHCLCEWSNR